MRTQNSSISNEVRYYSLTMEFWMLLPDGNMEIYCNVPERIWKDYRKAKTFVNRDSLILNQIRNNFDCKKQKRGFPNYELLKRR